MDGKSLRDSMHRELAHLATMRDELRVQAKLAKAEFTHELEQLETRWQHVQGEVRRLATDPKIRGELETSARRVLDELKGSYERIKHELKP